MEILRRVVDHSRDLRKAGKVRQFRPDRACGAGAGNGVACRAGRFNDLLALSGEVIATSAEGAIEAHDIRTRQAGRMTFIGVSDESMKTAIGVTRPGGARSAAGG